MKKPVRILAALSVVLLLAMYVSCLIFALMKSSLAKDLFRMTLGMTIAVPVVLYALLLAMRVFPLRKEEPEADAEPKPPAEKREDASPERTEKPSGTEEQNG